MDAHSRLDAFIDRYTPEVAALTRGAIARLQVRIPGATILVYDYYNALAIGWSPDDRTRHGVLSLALYPRWVNLCFLRGVDLADPHRLLVGSGSLLRTIRLCDAAQIDDPRVAALVDAAIASSDPPFDAKVPGALIIKGVSPNRRPRRP